MKLNSPLFPWGRMPMHDPNSTYEKEAWECLNKFQKAFLVSNTLPINYESVIQWVNEENYLSDIVFMMSCVKNHKLNYLIRQVFVGICTIESNSAQTTKIVADIGELIEAAHINAN